MAQKPAIELSVDARHFYEVRTQAMLFDKHLGRDLNKRLKAAVEVIAKDVRAEVLKPPLGEYKGRTRTRTTVASRKRKGKPPAPPMKIHRGLRQNIARGVKVTVSAGAKSKRVGVFIVSKGVSGDQGASATLKRKWDSPRGWRHPVFQRGQRAYSLSEARKRAKAGQGGDQSIRWVTQHGRPYFGSVIEGRKEVAAKAVEKALDDAVNAIASGSYTKGSLLK